MDNTPLFSNKIKYPILLVHGTGSRDDKRMNCWGRIPKAMEKAGADVFYSNQDAWGTTQNNAEIVKKSALTVLSKTGSKKLNIIALSKGGLESRYMIHKLGMSDKVASLTTISTPHHGSKTMDFLCKRLPMLLKFIAVFMNFAYRLYGDENPDFYNTCRQFTTAYSKKFNIEIPNSSKVYYQSYASAMKKPHSDMLLFIPHLFVKKFDGECDGIVSVDSSKWGVFKGIITTERIRGISHSDLRDFRRRGPAGKFVVEAYINIVNDLKNMGY